MSYAASVIEQVAGKLIVSCQAGPDEPLHGAEFMAAMARAAEMGGAAAIRANGPDDIAAIRRAVDLPVLGIYKYKIPGFEVFITPTFDQAQQIWQAGSHLIALDGTPRPRPDGVALPDLIARIHDELGVPVMADIASLDDALYAEAAGADLVASTLAGYTPQGRPMTDGPDLAFLTELLGHVRVPVVAEGRFHTPQQVKQALDGGVHAVVVGGAITRPQEITRRFVDALSL